MAGPRGRPWIQDTLYSLEYLHTVCLRYSTKGQYVIIPLKEKALSSSKPSSGVVQLLRHRRSQNIVTMPIRERESLYSKHCNSAHCHSKFSISL